MNGVYSLSNPFVGLRPFRSDESLLFFGRQNQTLELLERLHQNQFVAVTGSSGCGKSSLIRAGLIPKLKAGYLVDDREKWIIATMKPGEKPLDNLAAALLDSLHDLAPATEAATLQKKINSYGSDAILDLLKPAWANDLNFFLLVDQFEELFSDQDQKKSEISDEAIDFVNILLELSSQPDLPIYVVITMRSDYIGDCAQFYNLPEALNRSQYIVPRLNRVQLKSAIEGPVKLFEGRINPALTERLLNDAQNVKVELPLLQHVLMRIWEREQNIHRNGELDLEDYEDIGGIEKALSNDADKALIGMTPDQLNLAKKIFQALTRIDERGRKTRRRVHLQELVALTGKTPDELRSFIERFNDDNRSFLVTDELKGSDDLLIDISHESLISQWGTLNKWVDEEAESAKVFLRLGESADLYSKNKKNLLSENELHNAWQWYETYNPDKVWARRYPADFDKSIAYLKDSKKEEKRQMLVKRWRRRLVFAALVFITLLIGTIAVVIYVNDVRRKRELVLNYWNNSQFTRTQGHDLDALHLIAEAASINSNRDIARNLLIDAEAFLPQTMLVNIFPYEDLIHSAVISPDGKEVLTASNDGSVGLFDRETGKLTRAIFKNPGFVSTAVFSPDGKQVLTASTDGTSCTWSTTTGEKLLCLPHKSMVLDAIFTPDGKRILTTSADNNYIRIWSNNTGKLIDSLWHGETVNRLGYSSGAGKILAVSIDNSVLVWDSVHAKKPDTLKHPMLVRNAVFSPDGKKILTACDDHYARLWDIASKKQIDSMKHEAEVTDVAFSPDGNQMLTASKDKTAHLWYTSTARSAGAAMKHEDAIYIAAFSPDGKWIITAGWDKMIRTWSVATIIAVSKEKVFVHADTSTVTSAIFNPDGSKLLTTCDDNNYVRTWDAVTGNQLDSIYHASAVTHALFSPDGSAILVACKDSTLYLWNVVTKKKIASLKQRFPVTCIAFSPDGRRILAGYEDNYVRVWNADLSNPEKPVTSFHNNSFINSVAMNADNSKIVVAGSDSLTVLFDVASGKQTVFKHDNVVTSAVFSPDGKWILTASWDNTARLWDVGTGKQIGAPMTHTNGVNSAVFSPGEKKPLQILTGGFDRQSHLWSTGTKKEIGRSSIYGGYVTSAVFSPDGKSILVANLNFAQLREIAGDLDIPADLFQLQAYAATGVAYNAGTGETECLPSAKWNELRKKYDSRARQHYEVCKYREYNWWHRFQR